MPFPLDERFIIETEKNLGAKLPYDYVTKMMKENGGEVQSHLGEWLLYPIFDSSDKKHLKRTSYHVIKETKNAQEWEGFPSEALAIGSNGCGDQLILLRSEESSDMFANEVYWWDHETGAVGLVAAKFSDLLPE